MTNSTLDQAQAQIVKSTRISSPLKNLFEGEPVDNNLIALIICNDLPNWRIREDDKHVAFLTPSGNNSGYTLFVPRNLLSSDIIALSVVDCLILVEAAHTVPQNIKEAYSVPRYRVFRRS